VIPVELNYLEGTQMYHAVLSGAHQLIVRKNHLNKINVFPVPDGDTGTNMAYMMQTIINEAKPSENLSETLESIANAAINGSRGNSGIIFAEYFVGLYEKLKGLAQAKLSDFTAAVSHATQKAYQAIMNPIEGTILTVLKKAFTIADHHQSFNDYFKMSLIQAQQALKETKDQLEVLKKHNVVDAGAEGFTAFLEGFNYYLETGQVISTKPVSDVEDFVDVHEMVVTERYCTEALLMHVNRTSQEIKDIFSAYGSSLIVSGNSEKMRLHIHTDRPDRLFLHLREYGQILDQKIDDMIRQQQAIQSGHPKIAIVTDTIADIPESLLDQYHIHTLPMSLIVDQVSYIDRYGISTETFYALLQKAQSFSSSQPDRRTIERTLDFLQDHYDHVLVITVAKNLSGTYNALIQYAKDNPKVTIMDSRLNSGAEGLVVLEAAKWIWEGKPLEEVVAHLESEIARTKIYVSVKTLKYMVRQGRVSKVTGILAKIMNLKPVISLDHDGKGIIQEKALSLRSNIKKILKLVEKGTVKHYSLVHALAPERAEKLEEKMVKITGQKPLFTTTISPIVAMNAGIGAIAVSLTFEEEVV
jgi:DegV family protein with EDD domain